MTIQKHCHWSR